MTISPDLFVFVIVAALTVVAAAPLILLALWIADLRKGSLW